jgi:hypothetical protein
MIIKLNDAKKYLNENDGLALDRLLDKVAAGRATDGKLPLQCVVVEQDWPEFEPTWEAIEARFDKENK